MRILQIGIFKDHALGGCKVFFDGFVKNGYNVSPFDYRDIAKIYGQDRMNEMLLDMASKYDLLFIGKGELIYYEVLEDLRRRGTHIALWYGDIREEVPKWLRKLLPHIDTFFMSTGGELLKKYHDFGNNTVSAFYFNPSNPEIVSKYTATRRSYKYSVIYTGSYYPFNDGKRLEVVEYLKKRNDLTFFGGVEQLADNKLLRIWNRINKNYSKRIRGEEYIKAIIQSKIGIGVNAYNCYDKYTSDRLTHFVEFGCFYLSYHFPKVETLLKPGIEIETYKDIEELDDKLEFYLLNDDIRNLIASKGKKRILEEYNTNRMIAYMMGVIARKFIRQREWEEVYL